MCQSSFAESPLVGIECLGRFPSRLVFLSTLCPSVDKSQFSKLQVYYFTNVLVPVLMGHSIKKSMLNKCIHFQTVIK